MLLLTNNKTAKLNFSGRFENTDDETLSHSVLCEAENVEGSAQHNINYLHEKILVRRQLEPG